MEVLREPKFRALLPVLERMTGIIGFKDHAPRSEAWRVLFDLPWLKGGVAREMLRFVNNY